MSRWLGMRRSGHNRSPAPEEGATPPSPAPGRKTAWRQASPRTCRRRSSEETVESTVSQRSSHRSQSGEDVMVNSGDGEFTPNEEQGAGCCSAPCAHDTRTNKSDRDCCGSSGNTPIESDWEILEDINGDFANDGGDGLASATERPFSPGVDFSTACMVDKDGGEVQKDSGRVSEGNGPATGCRWEDAASIHSFLVRGPTYLKDKTKLPAGKAMCRLLGFDCFSEDSEGTTRVDHIASRGTCRERVEAMTSGNDAPFLFIINIQVRGTPPVSMVAYWAINRRGCDDGGGSDDGCRAPRDARTAGAVDEEGGRGGREDGQSSIAAADEEEECFPERERAFLGIVDSYADIPLSTFGGDGCDMMDEAPPRPYSDERNSRFKLIPRVIGGPWMVRKAVGSTPVLLGTKITHRYYRGEHYVETDMDTGSSAAAASLCGRCRGLSRRIDVELGVVLQANHAHELPEVLLGAVRLNGFGVEDPDLQTKLFP